MRQLTGLDASFVYSETTATPNHITGLYIYDSSTAPGGTVSFDSIMTMFARRLSRAASFRERLVRVPLDLDHPYWVNDPNFDLEFHVRHIALPAPGDWRQLCIQAARLHARPLDMTRAPWEVTVIDGLDDVPGLTPGSFALLWKTHHAAIDGASGIEILNAVHDLTPEPADEDASDDWRPEAVPSAADLLVRATARGVTNPIRAQRTLTRLTPQLRPLMRRMRERPAGPPAPATRFNVPVTGHRVFDGITRPLADFKAAKSGVPGATVNDAMISVVGGALRSYLLAHDELPDTPLVTMVPISVRSEEQKGTAGNQVSMMSASLATDVADPLERLAAVHRSTSESKELAQALGARTLAELSELTPGLLIGLGARAAARNAGRTPFNTTITNVPGSPVPLYFCGARMEQAYGLGPISHGAALFHVVGSYRGDVALSFTACREVLPDPGLYRRHIEEATDALFAAAARDSAPRPRARATTATRSRKAASTRRTVSSAR